MSLFRRKKENDLTKDQPPVHEDSTINIPPYAPHQNLSAVPYREPQVMTDLKIGFETRVMEFLDRTSPDQYNGSFIDNIVNRAKEQALRDIEVQRREHVHAIERSIASLWRGDQHYYEKLLEDYNREYEERKKELRRLKSIFHKGTAYEEYLEV